MTESLKVLLKKLKEELTEDDKKEILDAINAFKSAIENVCREHGFAYKSILSVTHEGIAPVLDIVAITQESEETK